jgi:hypothetical protein
LVHTAPIYSYSKSKGAFIGVTLEGTIILTRKKTNEAFYGAGVTATDLLTGVIRPPPVADSLYRMLDIKFGELAARTPPSRKAAGENESVVSLEKDNISTPLPKATVLDGGGSDSFPPPHYASQATLGTLHYSSQDTIGKSSTPSTETRKVPPLPPKKQIRKCLALYDYKSGVDGDLSFTKGDVIWISKEMGEWFEGKKNGEKGIFPSNYVSLDFS